MDRKKHLYSHKNLASSVKILTNTLCCTLRNTFTYVLVCAKAQAHMALHLHMCVEHVRGQLVGIGSLIVWVPGIKLRLSGFAATPETL